MIRKSTKKLCAIIFVFLLLTSLFSGATAMAAPTMTYDLQTWHAYVSYGEDITISGVLYNPNHQPLVGYHMTVLYDADKVIFEKCTVERGEYQAFSDKVRLTWSDSSQDASGALKDDHVVLFTLTFQAKANKFSYTSFSYVTGDANAENNPVADVWIAGKSETVTPKTLGVTIQISPSKNTPKPIQTQSPTYTPSTVPTAEVTPNITPIITPIITPEISPLITATPAQKTTASPSPTPIPIVAQNTPFPWWIVLIAALVLINGLLFIFLGKKGPDQTDIDI